MNEIERKVNKITVAIEEEDCTRIRDEIME